MSTNLDRMVTEDAAALAHVRLARTRARTDIRRTVALLGMVGALSLGYVVGHYAGSAPCDPAADGCRFVDAGQAWQTVGTVSWPVCPTEDAAGPCVWDATRDGNGTGRSFTVDAGTVTYLP